MPRHSVGTPLMSAVCTSIALSSNTSIRLVHGGAFLVHRGPKPHAPPVFAGGDRFNAQEVSSRWVSPRCPLRGDREEHLD